MSTLLQSSPLILHKSSALHSPPEPSSEFEVRVLFGFWDYRGSVRFGFGSIPISKRSLPVCVHVLNDSTAQNTPVFYAIKHNPGNASHFSRPRRRATPFSRVCLHVSVSVLFVF